MLLYLQVSRPSENTTALGALLSQAAAAVITHAAAQRQPCQLCLMQETPNGTFSVQKLMTHLDSAHLICFSSLLDLSNDLLLLLLQVDLLSVKLPDCSVYSALIFSHHFFERLLLLKKGKHARFKVVLVAMGSASAAQERANFI
jgi:hypothetical protein